MAQNERLSTLPLPPIKPIIMKFLLALGTSLVSITLLGLSFFYHDPILLLLGASGLVGLLVAYTLFDSCFIDLDIYKSAQRSEERLQATVQYLREEATKDPALRERLSQEAAFAELYRQELENEE